MSYIDETSLDDLFTLVRGEVLFCVLPRLYTASDAVCYLPFCAGVHDGLQNNRGLAAAAVASPCLTTLLADCPATAFWSTARQMKETTHTSCKIQHTPATMLCCLFITSSMLIKKCKKCEIFQNVFKVSGVSSIDTRFFDLHDTRSRVEILFGLQTF